MSLLFEHTEIEREELSLDDWKKTPVSDSLPKWAIGNTGFPAFRQRMPSHWATSVMGSCPIRAMGLQAANWQPSLQNMDNIHALSAIILPWSFF